MMCGIKRAIAQDRRTWKATIRRHDPTTGGIRASVGFQCSLTAANSYRWSSFRKIAPKLNLLAFNAHSTLVMVVVELFGGSSLRRIGGWGGVTKMGQKGSGPLT